jgi:hypothetical protein
MKTINAILEAVLTLVSSMLVLLVWLLLIWFVAAGGDLLATMRQDTNLTGREFYAQIDSTAILPDGPPTMRDDFMLGNLLVRDSLNTTRPGTRFVPTQVYGTALVSRTWVRYRIDDERANVHQIFSRVIMTRRGEHVITQGILGKYLDRKGTRYEL